MSEGRFIGEVETQWLRHGGADRDMKLLSNFAFVDPNEIRWEAHAGDVINGASIPEIAWSNIVGTPYIGDYRRATVLHDVACQKRTRPHKLVHKMLHDAMVCEGTDKAKAKLFYRLVRMFGPRWDQNGNVLADTLDVEIDELEAKLDLLLNDDAEGRLPHRIASA